MDSRNGLTMTETAFQDALATALKRLKTSDRLESEVRQSLAKYPAPIVEQVVSYLRQRKFIDDERFVARSVEGNTGKRAIGDALITDRLTRRGADESLVVEIVKTSEDEPTRIDTLLRGKFKPTDDFRKAARFLGGRGFSEEAIESGIERYFESVAEIGWTDDGGGF